MRACNFFLAVDDAINVHLQHVPIKGPSHEEKSVKSSNLFEGKNNKNKNKIKAIWEARKSVYANFLLHVTNDPVI